MAESLWSAHLTPSFAHLPLYPRPPLLVVIPRHARVQHQKRRDKEGYCYLNVCAHTGVAFSRSPGSFVRGMLGDQQATRLVTITGQHVVWADGQATRLAMIA